MTNPNLINLDHSQKCLAHCRHCGSVRGIARSGTGPHAGRIDCDGCGRFLNWMPFVLAVELGVIEPCRPEEEIPLF
jgi:hypothetical protein